MEWTYLFHNHYGDFSESDKIVLWGYALIFDFREHPYHDPLDKFNKENYAQWKSEEIDFDRFLNEIIEEYMSPWNVWYQRQRFTDVLAKPSILRST